MRCPFCHEDNDRVVDSRSAGDGQAIRRRRECLHCSKRFTTYERIEEMPLRVIKKNGSREAFDRGKILNGLVKACEKRPVQIERLEEEALKIEAEICSKYDREVPARQIGEMVMNRLRALDDVAYVRFASVYRAFKDVSDFVEEVKPMLKGAHRDNAKGAGAVPTMSPKEPHRKEQKAKIDKGEH
jgi:transcriptional repressor NrdR